MVPFRERGQIKDGRKEIQEYDQQNFFLHIQAEGSDQEWKKEFRHMMSAISFFTFGLTGQIKDESE